MPHVKSADGSYVKRQIRLPMPAIAERAFIFDSGAKNGLIHMSRFSSCVLPGRYALMYLSQHCQYSAKQILGEERHMNFIMISASRINGRSNSQTCGNSPLRSYAPKFSTSPLNANSGRAASK